MALVNHLRKFIYLMEPHTASRGVVNCLKTHIPGTSDIASHHDGIERLTYWRRQHLDPRRIKDYSVICTVRNPFDSLITKWKGHSPHKNKTFEEFLDLCWDHHWLKPGRGLYKDADYFCWYEDLQDDLRWLFSSTTLTMEHDPKHVTAGKEPWQSYYTPGIIDRLKARDDWKDYLTRFGYTVSPEGDTDIMLRVRAKLCQPIVEKRA